MRHCNETIDAVGQLLFKCTETLSVILLKLNRHVAILDLKNILKFVKMTSNKRIDWEPNKKTGVFLRGICCFSLSPVSCHGGGWNSESKLASGWNTCVNGIQFEQQFKDSFKIFKLYKSSNSDISLQS